MSDPAAGPPIRVKLLAKGRRSYDTGVWRRQLPAPAPGAAPSWGRCEFLFDPEERRYDWLVVYDDLPSDPSPVTGSCDERLACPPENTLFICGEPSTIKHYGRDFLDQFGVVLTSHEDWALDHPGVIRRMPCLRWFYGIGRNDTGTTATLDSLRAAPPPAKPCAFSTVCSSKRMGHTLHKHRFDFTQEIKASIPDMEVFGHGVREIGDKREALDGFRVHLAVENHLAPHHITEKLTDAFLGFCLPLYVGAPNADDYFPSEAFVALDIFDTAGSLEKIRAALDPAEYARRLPAIIEARRRVLEEHNLFAVLANHIGRLHGTSRPTPTVTEGQLRTRHAVRRSSPWVLARYWLDKTRIRIRHAGTGRRS